LLFRTHFWGGRAGFSTVLPAAAGSGASPHKQARRSSYPLRAAFSSPVLLTSAAPIHLQITQAKGKRRPIRSVEEWVKLDGYEGTVRQLIVTGLGHELPTFLLTNDDPQVETARAVIQTYASRNRVENRLGEQITFFDLDCLCSDARLNVDFDLTLTVVADLLYRRLAERLRGFVRTSPARLLRKFIATPGMIEIRTNEVIVHLSKRAHNPYGSVSPAEISQGLGYG